MTVCPLCDAGDPTSVITECECDPTVCPRCDGPTDPYWFCSAGYCPECCEETDETDDDDPVYGSGEFSQWTEWTPWEITMGLDN